MDPRVNPMLVQHFDTISLLVRFHARLPQETWPDPNNEPVLVFVLLTVTGPATSAQSQEAGSTPKLRPGKRKENQL